MNLRELEVFNAVMSCSSMTEAAKSLNVSQPAISTMVKHTEDQLGFKLFKRLGGRLVPTPEANELYEESGKIFTQLATLNRLTKDLRVGRSGFLAVIGNPTLTNFLLPEAVARFRAEHPQVKVRLETALSTQIVDRVARREFDLGLVYGPTHKVGAEAQIIGHSTIVCALHPSHPLATRSVIEAADLEDQEVITFAEDAPIRRTLEDVLRKEGRELKVMVEVSFSLTACFLAHQRAGIALVDGLIARDGVFPDLVIRPLQPVCPIDIMIVHPRNRPRSVLSAEYEHLLRDVVLTSAESARERQRRRRLSPEVG